MSEYTEKLFRPVPGTQEKLCHQYCDFPPPNGTIFSQVLNLLRLSITFLPDLSASGKFHSCSLGVRPA